ncbi:MAG TPA: hypothetical protein VNL77_19925 [Roseiflexaceae bacterium]|nr:hypothetical protein [Roseiflexaceae bacterium]
MIQVELARQLKRAGLAWQPSERDCFAIPDSQLDGQVFVVSQQTTTVEVLKGRPALTFHGSSEWALDYLFTTDAVWLPSETQLRQAVERLAGEGAALTLERTPQGYHCRAGQGQAWWEGAGGSAEEAYANTVLAILQARDGVEH